MLIILIYILFLENNDTNLKPIYEEVSSTKKLKVNHRETNQRNETKTNTIIVGLTMVHT